MKKEKIRFVRRYEVQAVDGPVYAKGDIELMTPDACEHFVRRGAAEFYTADMEKAEKAEAAAEAKAQKEAEEKAKKEAEEKAKKAK